MADQASKLLIWGVILISVVSIALSGYKYFFLQDFVVRAMVACDPAQDSCFVSVCDPIEGECSTDESENTSYYKIYERSARNLPACDSLEACGEMQCDTTNNCVEYTCNEDLALEIGDACSTPVDSPRSEPRAEGLEGQSIDTLPETGE